MNTLTPMNSDGLSLRPPVQIRRSLEKENAFDSSGKRLSSFPGVRDVGKASFRSSLPDGGKIQAGEGRERREAGSLFRIFFGRGFFFKFTAILSLVTFFETQFARDVALYGAPFQDYTTFSESDVQSYLDRASRLSDVDAWNNYTVLGLATERVEWEEAAFDLLSSEYDRIDGEDLTQEEKESLKVAADAEYDAAYMAWEADAEEHILTERGMFLAKQEAIQSVEITTAEYDAIIAEAQAVVAGQTELNLVLWDSTVDPLHQELVNLFEAQLASEVDNAKAAGSSLAGAELTAFEAELDDRADQLRQEFEIRDSFYLLSARNDYISFMRNDDMSTRLLSDSESASSVTTSVIETTLEDLTNTTQAMILDAQSQLEKDLSDPTISDASAAEQWQLTWRR